MSIFCRLCPFPQVYEQCKEWLLLELHKMIRVWHIFAYPGVFLLLCDLGRQAGVLKLVKKAQFLVFLVVCVLFPKFLARLGIDLLELYETIRVLHLLAWPVVFILVCDLGRHKGMLKHEKWSVLSIFGHCSTFPQDIGPVFGANLTVFYKNCDSMFYNCMPYSFYWALKLSSAVRSAQTNGECSNLSIFSR